MTTVHPLFRTSQAAAIVALCSGNLMADENIFGTVKGSETLPHGHIDAYQTTTLREGKPECSYNAWDLDTELEYGITDMFQMSVELKQHYFDIKGSDELRNGRFYEFGGIELAGKYRFTSVFKDGYGLAFLPEAGYLCHDDVGGFDEHEIFFAPKLIYQKNLLDDTLIFAANAGVEWAFGKKPAEQYAREFSLDGGVGLSYRFAPNWFAGLEARCRAEYPDLNPDNFEHAVVFVGPALHYGGEKWWATLQYGYQAWGVGVDETGHQTFAEETRNELRLKLGWSF